MDHSTHHADMNHGDMDHGDMDMGGKCSMNMLFTWSFKNLCIVFPRWHITGVATLIISLLVIVLLSACYEAVRNLARRYEVSFAQRLKAYMGPAAAGRDGKKALERKGRVTLAALYAVQVFYSFFIMLLFMTYNGWVMLAVTVGAFIGYLVFGESTAAKSVACH